MIVHSERLIPAALLVLAFRWYRSRRFDLSLRGIYGLLLICLLRSHRRVGVEFCPKPRVRTMGSRTRCT